MDAVPLEVERVTVQPGPKVIANVEFARCAVGILRKINLGSCVSEWNLRDISSLHLSLVRIVLPDHPRRIACCEEATQGVWTRAHSRHPVPYRQTTSADGCRTPEEELR